MTNIVEKISESSLPETISNLLNVLAEKLGVGVNHFWPIFVKQQYYEGLIFLISLVAFIVMGVGLLTWGKIELSKKNWSENSGYWAPFIIGIFILLICAMAFIFEGTDSIMKMCNPEYWAVKEIIQMAK